MGSTRRADARVVRGAATSARRPVARSRDWSTRSAPSGRRTISACTARRRSCAGSVERFDEQAFEWTPYLYRLLGDGATEVLEQALVESGEIQALGFRYVGRPNL